MALERRRKGQEQQAAPATTMRTMTTTTRTTVTTVTSAKTKPKEATAPNKDEGENGKGKGRAAWKQLLYDGFALVAMGTSAAAMVVEGSLIVNVVGIICALLGPAAAIQQRTISQSDDLRQTEKKLRARVDELQDQVSRLNQQNHELEKSAQKLQKTEMVLAEISKVQGQNIDLLIKQLEEYKSVQNDIKMNLEAAVIQNLISVVVRSDVNRDNTMDPNEVDQLVLRLKNIDGVRFNERNFRRAIEGTGFSLRAILDITQNLLDDSVPDEDNIFVVRTDDLISSSSSSYRKGSGGAKDNKKGAAAASTTTTTTSGKKG